MRTPKQKKQKKPKKKSEYNFPLIPKYTPQTPKPISEFPPKIESNPNMENSEFFPNMETTPILPEFLNLNFGSENNLPKDLSGFSIPDLYKSILEEKNPEKETLIPESKNFQKRKKKYLRNNYYQKWKFRMTIGEKI